MDLDSEMGSESSVLDVAMEGKHDGASKAPRRGGTRDSGKSWNRPVQILLQFVVREGCHLGSKRRCKNKHHSICLINHCYKNYNLYLLYNVAALFTQFFPKSGL